MHDAVRSMYHRVLQGRPAAAADLQAARDQLAAAQAALPAAEEAWAAQQAALGERGRVRPAPGGDDAGPTASLGQ